MPESGCYYCCELPGKGQGVVAARDVRAGELIIAEKPLIVLPWWIRHCLYPRWVDLVPGGT